MIVVDTNVLVYAIGGPHPLRQPSARVVDAARRGVVTARTIESVYLELLQVLSRRLSRSEAAEAVRDYLVLLGPLLDVTDSDRAVAIDLFERHPALGSVDALVAAIGLRPEIEAVLTADSGFASVPGLRALDPRSPELEAMIA